MKKEVEPYKKAPVWDVATRLFHWLLVVAFALSAYSAFQDKFGIYADIHLWSGISVIVLVIWRVLWGFVGSEPSRFSSFVRGPKAITAYLRGEQKHPFGHNPLGGISVLLMLVLLLVQAVLGLYSSDGMLFSGPLAGSDGDDIQDIHETLGFVLFGIVGLHVAAVLWYWFVRKDNLILPMITGQGRFERAYPPMMRSSIVALIVLLGVGYVVYQLVLA